MLFRSVPAYKRPVNMVFQHYALFPHLSVADNIAYGLLQRMMGASATLPDSGSRLTWLGVGCAMQLPGSVMSKPAMT